MESEKYLKVDGIIVGCGTEADMVNFAASFDSDYEILELGDLTPEELAQWTDDHESGLA